MFQKVMFKVITLSTSFTKAYGPSGSSTAASSTTCYCGFSTSAIALQLISSAKIYYDHQLLKTQRDPKADISNSYEL
jgi:hypothetical protein